MGKVLVIKRITCLSASKSTDLQVVPTMSVLGNAYLNNTGGVAPIWPADAEGTDFDSLRAPSGNPEGTDDLYIKINGVKVWPAGKKYQKITYPDSVSPDCTAEVPEGATTVKLTLMEYDWFSSDDLLGEFDIPTSADTKDLEIRVENPEEGSAYLVMYQVRSA